MFLFGFLWIITHHSRNKSHHPSGHITSALFSSDIYYPWTFLTVHHHLHCTIHASHAWIAVECKASISHRIRNTSSQISNWHLQLPMQTLSIHVSTITLLLSCQSLSLKPQTPSASTICFALYMQLAVRLQFISKHHFYFVAPLIQTLWTSLPPPPSLPIQFITHAMHCINSLK